MSVRCPGFRILKREQEHGRVSGSELFRRRLLAAVTRDLSGLRKISECREELQRQRRLLAVIQTPEIKLQRADVQQLSVVKKEQPVHVKSEDEVEEKPVSSQLHQIETRTNGEECGGNYEERNPVPGRHFKPEAEVKTEDSSETETDDSDDWREDSERRPGSRCVKRNQVRKLKPEERRFSCSECGNAFKKKIHLESHMLIHTGEKPFGCDQCGKTFRFKSSLNTHKLLHSRKKPFSCEECGETFTQKSSLTTHLLIHTGEKPFSCEECGKSFRKKSNLNRHKMDHTRVRPFVCDECGKTFGVKRNLNRHKLIHTGEKPFSCDKCGETFRYSQAVKSHKMVHAGEKPFVNDEYGKTFTDKRELKKHKMVHTRKKVLVC